MVKEKKHIVVRKIDYYSNKLPHAKQQMPVKRVPALI